MPNMFALLIQSLCEHLIKSRLNIVATCCISMEGTPATINCSMHCGVKQLLF